MIFRKLQKLLVVLVQILALITASAVQHHHQRQLRLAIPGRRHIDAIGQIGLGAGESICSPLVAFGLPVWGARLCQGLRELLRLGDLGFRHQLRPERDYSIVLPTASSGNRTASFNSVFVMSKRV